MGKRHSKNRDRGAVAGPEDIFKRRPTSVKSHRRPDGRWELLHPGTALEMADDLEEVQQMRAAGERDVAVDELRWLLSECHDAVDVHYALGELAFEEEDWRLARAHFGHAFDLGRSALPESGVDGRLSYDLPANRTLFQASKGLAFCLRELGRLPMSLAVLREMTAWDSSDPLGARDLLEKWSREAAELPQTNDGDAPPPL